ncbi:hypothetical protein BDV32DRAFT_157658 [Aspergillus pseudonomiae]|nr:hypothetical protein BDV32DRAFT_157658 [Aspergillus pseudonomiae]
MGRLRESLCHPFSRYRGPGKTQNQKDPVKIPDNTTNALLPTSFSQFTIRTTQSTEPFRPLDLWQTAYDQLDEEDQRVLSNVKVTTNFVDQENQPRDLIGEIIHLTTEQYEQCQRKETGKLRASSKKIINAILSFKDIISAVAAFDRTQYAASVWAIVLLGLTITKNHHDLQDALFNSSEYLADVLAQCAFIEKKYYLDGSLSIKEELAKALIGLYRAILHYAALVQKTQTASVGRKLLDCVTALTEHPLTEHKVSVEKERECLRQWIELGGYLHCEEDAENILHKVDKLAECMNSLIEQFSLVNLYVAEGALYDSLINELEDFSKSSDGKCIFWLNGMAGTGKSTTARTVAQSFKDQGLLGTAFFFKRGEADRGNAKYLISTITRQLPLVKLYPDQSTTIVIVIDTLDKYNREDYIQVIFRLLFKLQEIKSIHLRIFLTSRPKLPIRFGFKQNKSYQDLVLHRLPAPLSEIQDIRSLPAAWPGNEIIEELVRMAVLLFIFAATACRFIKEGTHLKKRLQKLLEFQATTTATQMDKIYLPVLNQLIGDDDDSKELVEEFQDIGGAIILLATLLSIECLAWLLQVSTNNISKLLDPLHSVLHIPSHRKAPVHILHLSFRDYLLNTESPFHVHKHETHRKIASHYFQIMDTQLKHNICGLASYGTQCKDINPQVIKQHLTIDLQYSSHYWAYHLKQSKGHISEAKILAFLKKHFLHWLETLALIGSVSEAVEIIDTLNIGAEISDFLYNTKRFTFQNAYIKIFYSKVFKQLQRLLVIEDSWSPSLQILEGHSDWVNSAAFSPDGYTLVSGSRDSTVKLWDTTTGTERETLKGHSSSVYSVTFSPDGCTLVYSSGVSTIKLWDTTTGTERQTLKSHPNADVVTGGSLL